MEKIFDIEMMQEKHLDGILEIENSCFEIPWSRKSFQDELNKKNMAMYVVALKDKKVVGYGGMWHIINEGHITNIAVDKNFRNMGIGKLIVENLIKIAREKEMIGITLEVRKSNEIALNLYKKYGFILEGIRKEYYENKEDAIIMWKHI